MAKNKKDKPVKIDPRVLARPRLDALLVRHARGELDQAGLLTSVRTLMTEVGHEPLLGALVKRMEGTPEGERDALVTLAGQLASPAVVDNLWQQVKKPHALSLEAKVTILTILKAMGEEVDIADPGRYVSLRDLNLGDVKTARDVLRAGVRGLARHLRASRDSGAVETIMHRVQHLPEDTTGGREMLLELIKMAEQGGTDLDADFLFALQRTTPSTEVRQAATRALEQLAAQGVKPVAPVILTLEREHFYGAFMTDPRHPWQQGVTVAWERGEGTVHALVFLLDFGPPWHGALRDTYPTVPMTPSQFQHDFVDQPPPETGEHIFRVNLARAQAAIAAAVQANERHKIALPRDFADYRHLVDRWVLEPPAAALAADTTRDELAELPLVPNRDVVDDAVPDAVDSIESFADLMNDVDNVFADELGDLRWFQKQWAIDYLTGLRQGDPRKVNRVDENLDAIFADWESFHAWLWFLVDRLFEVQSLADLRGFHLTEFSAQDADGLDPEDLRASAEFVQSVFQFLARRGVIPASSTFLQQVNAILAGPDPLALPPRPEPLGGETAVWHLRPGTELPDEAVTYNAWWTALVLHKEFKRNLDKMRRTIDQCPDAAAKQLLLNQLEVHLQQDPEYLEGLLDDRLPMLGDFRRAKTWFHQETVNAGRAW